MIFGFLDLFRHLTFLNYENDHILKFVTNSMKPVRYEYLNRGYM